MHGPLGTSDGEGGKLEGLQGTHSYSPRFLPPLLPPVPPFSLPSPFSFPVFSVSLPFPPFVLPPSIPSSLHPFYLFSLPLSSSSSPSLSLLCSSLLSSFILPLPLPFSFHPSLPSLLLPIPPTFLSMFFPLPSLLPF